MEGEDQKVDVTTGLINTNTTNNLNPNYKPPDPLSNYQYSKPDANTNNIITTIPLNNPINSVSQANSAINPNFFKDKTVLNEFDLDNDVYKRLGGNKIEEKIIKLTPGKNACITIASVVVISIILIIAIITFSPENNSILSFLPIPIVAIIVSLALSTNFITITPNNAVVLTYYGKYVGSSKEDGYFFIKPCTKIERISLKSNQYNGNKIKVNDKKGSPVKLGLVAVWKVRDTAKVIFGVNNYQQFVNTQAESAVRFVGCKYPYESENENEPCLKAGSEEINQILKLELERRVKIAGIEIEDARITEISYGDEVATAMLEKQTSEIKVMAKEKIALGAVDVIEKSIKEIERRNVCQFQNEEKVKLVSNLMLILNTNSNNKNGNVLKLNI